MSWLSSIPIIGSVVDGITGIFNSSQQAKTSKRNTDRQIQANWDLANLKYQKDLEQWYRENAYNAPDEQMRRLRNAGLNPNLVYGTGTVTGNTTTSGPRFDRPDVEYNYEPFQFPTDAISRGIQFIQENRLKDRQIAETEERVKNLATQRDALKAKTESEIINQIYYKLRGKSAGLKYNLDQSLFKTQVDYARENLRRLRGEISLQDYKKQSLLTKTFGDYYRGLGYKQDYENFKSYGFTRGNAPWWVRVLINFMGNGRFDTPESAARRDRERHIQGYYNGEPYY